MDKLVPVPSPQTQEVSVSDQDPETGAENYDETQPIPLFEKSYAGMLEFVQGYEKSFDEIHIELLDNLAEVVQLHLSTGRLFDPQINDTVSGETITKLQSTQQKYEVYREGPSGNIVYDGMEGEDEFSEYSPKSDLSQMSPEQIDEEYEKMGQKFQ